MSYTLAITGMHCGSCVGRAEKALLAAPDVTEAAVNLATSTARVTGGDPLIVARALTAAGYPATPEVTPQADTQHTQEAASLRRATMIAAALTLPVFILAMGTHLIPAMHHWVMNTLGEQTSWLIQFALTTAVLVWPGRAFYQRGVPALLRRQPDMNSLVAIGTFAAWAFSTVVTFAPALIPGTALGVYFEAAAVIVTLILLGRYLEAGAKGRTGAAITKLIGLQPKTATVLRDGQPVAVPIAEVIVGDTLQLKPGEKVAVDGRVLTGSTYIDESMMTGEALPIAKARDDLIVAGTVNGTGAVTYRATRVGADTALAQIIRMVSDAQGAKLPVQDLVNQITSWFVPVVLVLATLTVLVWLVLGPSPAYALVAGVSVLIIACPCAMGLATPTSIMVGTGRAAEMGVLFRKGDALQALQGVGLIALDKTGTLTAGKPVLTDLHVFGAWDESDILRRAAAVEALSEHPIATAIVTAARDRGLTLPQATDFEATAGFGVTATVEGHQIIIGAARQMEAAGIPLHDTAVRAQALAAKGRTPLYIAQDGAIAALIAVADPIKSGTPEALAALRALGLEIAMITGDNQVTANMIGQQLGITKIIAEVLPSGKTRAIADLRKTHKTAFVGDGINDAPALAAADVGIAIGTGTDVAIEAADVVLMSGDLRGVANAVTISRATLRNIRENLCWAFGYNVLLIPVAAGVLYPATGLLLSPMLAAGAMALSSVFVLSNALRLTWVKPAVTSPVSVATAA